MHGANACARSREAQRSSCAWQSSVIVTIDLDRNAHFPFVGKPRGEGIEKEGGTVLRGSRRERGAGERERVEGST